MSTSREESRDALVALLATALVGTGLPCKTVTGSKVTTLNGLTPLVSVLSGGSMRESLTFQGNISSFMFEVQVWVLQKDTGWTTAQAEDALDTIEALIAGVYEGTRSSTGYTEYSAESQVFEVSVSGIPYYVERIPTHIQITKS